MSEPNELRERIAEILTEWADEMENFLFGYRSPETIADSILALLPKTPELNWRVIDNYDRLYIGNIQIGFAVRYLSGQFTKGSLAMHTEQVTSSAHSVDGGASTYESPAERLAYEAQTAIAAADGNIGYAVQLLLFAAENDVELLWEMVAGYRHRAACDVIEKTKRSGQQTAGSPTAGASASSPFSRAGRAEDVEPPRTTVPPGAAPSTSGEKEGHPCRDSQHDTASLSSLAPNEKAPGAGYCRHNASQHESAAQTPSPAVSVRAHQRCAPGHASRGLDAVEGMNRSLLRTFLVNGTPIADVTAAEARLWGTAQQRRGRFAILMADGVPDNMLIGACKTDEDAIIAARLSESENV